MNKHLNQLKEKIGIIGQSQSMYDVLEIVDTAAPTNISVLIYGESGTGKELVAKLIHHKGPRADSPFVPVNCGAIPSELMESEFFGHKKGSFTGAIHDKKGLFQLAENGTLFLDEIAELPLHMQVKLLRAIQEKTIRPIGSDKEITINVRILSASHRNLLELVEQDLFRQDLFYRINVIELKVPSLKERIEDIPRIADYLLIQLAGLHAVEKPQLTSNALKTLMAYNFPGNIRELENILERAITLCADKQIRSQDLNIIQPSSQASDTQFSSPESQLKARNNQTLDEYLEEIETTEIHKALEQAQGNKTQAAKLLGISFRAMRYKLKKLNID